MADGFSPENETNRNTKRDKDCNYCSKHNTIPWKSKVPSSYGLNQIVMIF